MYDTRDELLREIQAGEDSHLDFKEVVFKGDQVRFAREPDRASMAMAKTLSCFANTDGGVVVLGVTDRGASSASTRLRPTCCNGSSRPPRATVSNRHLTISS